MFLHRHISFRVIMRFAWRVQLATFLLSTLVWALYEFAGWTFIGIPFLPVATIGTAVAFYVGFKNNSAYDRLWEGRRIWGSITNASRAWGAAVIDIIGSRGPASDEMTRVKKELLHRHIAWMSLLRLQLRRVPVFSEKEYTGSTQLQVVRAAMGDQRYEEGVADLKARLLTPEDAEGLEGHVNPASWLLKRQSETLIGLKNSGALDGLEHTEMNRLVGEFWNQQGAAERIKTFPFPRQYANFSVVFVYIFITLLPFAIINELHRMDDGKAWLTIPFSMLIAWVFNVMEQVGDASENPFDNGINDVPMTAICRNVEIELRSMLGEADLPPKITPVDGILM